MNEYFEVAIRQHQERGQRLLGRIPKPHSLPQEFHPLVQTSKREISDVIDDLETLLTEPKMLSPRNQTERLRRFRRAVQYLGLLETTCVSALERHTNDDGFLSQMISRVIGEIAYPLLPPVVTGLSQQYFHIYPHLNLLFVPLTEGDFLLHLPDLYHELGHPLVTERYDPNVRPFQLRLLEMLDIVSEYLDKEREKESRGRGPKQFTSYFQVWAKSWLEWAVELFCDLFAVYTVGPAYGWAHIHLFTKVGDNPYRVPLLAKTSHPADQARMQVILQGLYLIGFEDKAHQIENRWTEIVRVSGAIEEPEYQRCFPEHILEQFAQKAYEAAIELKCRVATPDSDQAIFLMLNEAWDVFWNEPKQYISWERKAVQDLRTLCSTKAVQ